MDLVAYSQFLTEQLLLWCALTGLKWYHQRRLLGLAGNFLGLVESKTLVSCVIDRYIALLSAALVS